ncbi:MAG: HAD family hydrolase [Rhodothermales bacterium]
MTNGSRTIRYLLFDWGDTLMRDFPEYTGPMASWPTVETIPHAREVLAGLCGRWKLALATNAADSDEEEIRAALHRGGLNRFLDRIYCYRKIGHRKPSQKFFAFIKDDLGLGPECLIMVGDHFETDVLGANRAGLRSIWLNEHSDEVREGDMHQTIHDFRALPRALQRWESVELSVGKAPAR